MDHSKEPKESNFLKELLAFIETTDLEFVQLEKAGNKVVFKRSGDAVAVRRSSSNAVELQEKEPEPKPVYSIRSPIVGRYFSSMGADRPPLVVEGGRVTAGQKVAVVEAMKIKKEVFSAYTGKITRILVRDNDPVEYGQELFVVEPESENV